MFRRLKFKIVLDKIYSMPMILLFCYVCIKYKVYIYPFFYILNPNIYKCAFCLHWAFLREGPLFVLTKLYNLS